MARKSKSSMNDVVLIIKDMIESNQDILKLLKYNESDVDIYAQPDLSRKEAETIADKFILERTKEFDDPYQCCYMILEYADKAYHHRSNSYYNGNTFNFIVLCHNDIKINRHVGDRCLEIESIIEEMFDKQRIDSITCDCEIVSSAKASGKNNSNYTGRYITMAFVNKNDNMINKAVGR